MQNILKFKRARDCLRYLVKKYKIKEMYIPYYLCDVMRHTLFEEGCKPLFYHIDDNFMPERYFPKESYILYPNYFGVFGVNVKRLAAKYPKLIVDNAHAFFDEPQGFACFNSGIKFGLGENAYLWLGDEYFPKIEKEDSIKDFCRKKFLEYHKIYSGINKLKFEISDEICPFCYPLLLSDTEEADCIVKELTAKGLEIYRYWNPLPESFNEYKFYSGLVPVPVARLLSLC